MSLMPYSFFKKLDLPEPRPIRMAIHLENKTVTFPRGICEDLLVKVDKFVFLADFIILDTEADLQVPIILGRPFLFAFRADLRFCPRRREEIMAVRDRQGRQFETTICQPQSGEWLDKVYDEERHGDHCHEPPPEDF